MTKAAIKNIDLREILIDYLEVYCSECKLTKADTFTGEMFVELLEQVKRHALLNPTHRPRLRIVKTIAFIAGSASSTIAAERAKAEASAEREKVLP